MEVRNVHHHGPGFLPSLPLYQSVLSQCALTGVWQEEESEVPRVV